MDNVTTLTSLAILKVNADIQRQDYVDNVVPFVLDVLARHKPEPVTSQNVQRLLRDSYGLQIPIHVVELLLRRLAKPGRRILKREGQVFHVDRVKSPNIEVKRADARRRLNVVIGSLREYASTIYGKTWSEDEATSNVIGYLSRFSIDFLRTFAQGSALPEVKATREEDLFIVNSFIRHVIENSTSIFENLVVFVKGHMLANALICPDLESLTRRFGDVVFYLDTPLLMRLLSPETEPRRAAAVELLELLRALNATLAVFHHTVEEVEGILDWCERNINNHRAVSPLLFAMQQAGKTASDLSLLRGQVESIFKSSGISIRRTPVYSPEFQIDEQLLQAALDEEIGYKNPRAKEYDVNSIRSIYSLRKGRSPRRLEDAVAVLVTSNKKLAQIAFDYGKEHEAFREISPVITDFSLANIAWLKAPLSAPDLPSLEITAACYAALEPKDELWSRYLIEIDRLQNAGNITARDHAILRSSLRAREQLVNLTRGSEDALSERTISEILARAEEELIAEHRDKFVKEIARFEIEAEAIQQQQALALEKEKAKRESAESERTRLLQAHKAQRRRLLVSSQRIGSLGAKILFWVLVLAAYGFSVTTLFLVSSLSKWPFLIRVGIALFVSLGLLWGIYNWAHGLSFRQLSNQFGSWLQRKSFNLLSQMFLQTSEFEFIENSDYENSVGLDRD